MPSLFKALPLLALAALPLSSAAQDGEGRRIAEATFTQISGSERGWIDQGAFANAGGNVFAAMDYDGDLKLTLAEFLVFDAGMRAVAKTPDDLMRTKPRCGSCLRSGTGTGTGWYPRRSTAGR